MSDVTPQAEPVQATPPEPQPDKPVPKEVLERLRDMDMTRSRLGQQLLDLENEKIFLLANTRRLDEERGKLFSALLIERGHAPNTPAQIHPETGLLSLLKNPD